VYKLQFFTFMLSNTGSIEFVVNYVVYRLPAIAAILYWITMKAVQQLTGLTEAGPMDRPIRPVSCWTRPRHESWCGCVHVLLRYRTKNGKMQKFPIDSYTVISL